MAWNIDEEPYPGPYEQPTPFVLLTDAVKELYKSFHLFGRTTNRVSLYTGYYPLKPLKKIKTPKIELPKRTFNAGPRPSQTFNRRGNRNY